MSEGWTVQRHPREETKGGMRNKMRGGRSVDRITELGPRGVPGDRCTPGRGGNVALDHRGEVRSLLSRILLTMGCTAIGSHYCPTRICL